MAQKNKFVRLAPYNVKTGALCMRYTMGGRTFLAGEWYTLPADVAAQLKDLEQASGAAVFQIFDEEGFRKVAQSELSAAMIAAGLQGLAVNAPIEMPVVKTPKTGPVKSKFEGLKDKVGDVDMSSAAGVTTSAVAKSEAPAAPTTEELVGMDENALLDVAEDMGLDYDPEAGETELRTVITTAIDATDAEE